MAYTRIDRIAKEIKRELGAILLTLKDPRIPMMTSIITVKVTRDLAYVNIGVSIPGDQETQKEAIAGLNSAKGFIRREISRRVNLRVTPELIFEIDHSIEHGGHILDLLHQIKKDEDQ